MTMQAIRLISLFLLGHLYIIPMAVAKVAQNEKVLQSVANLDQFQSTEGNQIRLIQTAQGCRIEVIFYGEMGKNKENYLFSFKQNQAQLQHVARYEYHYSNGGLSNLSENKGIFKTIVKRIELNPKAMTSQQDFKTYLNLFAVTALGPCH